MMSLEERNDGVAEGWAGLEEGAEDCCLAFEGETGQGGCWRKCGGGHDR